MNARVGDGEVEGVVGKYGVPGENESGERLLDMCVEQELTIGNSFFKKKGINKCDATTSGKLSQLDSGPSPHPSKESQPGESPSLNRTP